MENIDVNTGRNMHNNKVRKKKRKNTFLKVIVRILIVLLVIAVILLGVLFALIGNKLEKLNYTQIDKSQLGINSEVNSKLKNYRNIALFGVDTRDITNNKGSRSDAIIIVSINKITKEVKLASVYRDTYINIEGHGLDKVTHAYAYGGPELAIKTLNQNLDLNIEEYATVNFASVANIINSIGGIEVNIEDYEIQQMNKYIKDTSKNTGISSSEITSSGKQTLDGVQAVTYSRIRKTVGGDYKRTERMRTVVTETFNKTKRMNVSDINDMIDTVCENVETNITSKQITTMLPQAVFFNINASIGWPYEVRGVTLNRWYGVPVNLEKNVSELHKDLFGQENYEPTETVKNISNQIINKTGIK